MITLNYVILSNYYRCRRVSVVFVLHRSLVLLIEYISVKVMEMLKTSVSKTQFQMIKEIGYQNERLQQTKSIVTKNME
jgi:hypothetical protein